MSEHARLFLDPERKSPTSGVRVSLSEPTIVLVTVCSKNRVPWLANNAVHRTLEEVWRKANAWLVGYYMLMPDHLHLFCAPRNLRFTIEAWTKYWKSEFSRQRVHEAGEWQRSLFHHRLRNAREYSEKWRYVQENPQRKGLVSGENPWPFQGTINHLVW